MAHVPGPERDPAAEALPADQIATYDALRREAPLAMGPDGAWAVLRHADVVRVLDDHETFSNLVSHRMSVPNGMDPPQHTAFREIVDRYYTPERMSEFEPVIRSIARELVDALPRRRDIDLMAELAEPFANHVQCAFMGWPDRLREPLRDWVRGNQAAIRAQDRRAMSQVATEFDGYITEQLEARRAAGAGAPDDNTTRLLHETVDGRPLTDDEIVSIVRNWTVGELGTIAASVGIIVHHLATRPESQPLARGGADLAAMSDEILRMHAPLLVNRRRTTREVTLGGRTLPPDERIVVVWASANRDEDVMGDPDQLRLDRDPAQNLLYGRGVHACPGAPLARMELRVVMEALLAATTSVVLGDEDPVPAAYPASGFSRLTVRLS